MRDGLRGCFALWNRWSDTRGGSGNARRVWIFLHVLGIATLGWDGFAAAGEGQIAAPASLEIKLFAREPEVVDPVALCFDEHNKMYVVEMRDYPLGIGAEHKPGGTIRVLEDLDGDGKADRSTVFARDLRFPTSIVPWKGGVFVAAPPEIIYLKDTNGDNVADVREVAFAGFNLGVTDSNLNGLRWGLDNRIHGCNGGNGGKVHSTKPDSPVVDIQGADYSFDPETGDFQTTFQTGGGFGEVFDIWGRSFVTYNVDHVQQRVIALRYLARFAGMPPIGATTNISDHGDMAEIYQISIPETRVNHPEQSGHFSSAGGAGYIGHPAYGEFFGSFTVGDVVANLVHRDLLAPDGPIFRATRGPDEQKKEFIASTDNAARFTGLELGPDGALYLIDMQRDVIEHPDYIPEKVKAKLNLRAGEDRGRIYRITPKNRKVGEEQRERNAFAKMDANNLAAQLSSGNQWTRTTAQRLIVELRQADVRKGLASILENDSPDRTVARVHALWTLHGLQALTAEQCERTLDDKTPEIRENGMLVSERFVTNSPALRAKIVTLLNDSSPRVRFQAALTAGELRSAAVVSALAELFVRDAQYRFTRLAVLASTHTNAHEILAAFLQAAPRSAPYGAQAVEEVCDLIAARAEKEPESFAGAFNALNNVEAPDAWKTAAMGGFLEGLERTGSRVEASRVSAALANLSDPKTPELFAAAWKLSRRMGLPDNAAQQIALTSAIKKAGNSSLADEIRISAIHVLELGSYAEVTPALFRIFDENAPTELQAAALRALAVHRNPILAQEILNRWQSFAPSLRNSVINLLLSRVPWHGALVSAIESGKISLGELNLDLEQRRTLMRDSTPEIQKRAAKFLGDEEYSNRKAIVEEMMGKLPAKGDPVNGRGVFEKNCAQCHHLANIGFKVGPDLSSVAHRSVEDIVSNILDPNMAINPAYISFTAETDSGDLESGILASDTRDSVTLLQAQEKRVTIARKNIKRLRASGVSLMPEGFDKLMSPTELRDLVAFIQKAE